MPGFWKFMYWVVPFTYLGEGMLVTGVDNIPITCSSEELLTIVTPAGQTCAAYLGSYISMAGGYIPQNLSAGECQYCPVSNSRDILSNFSMEYGHRWRNLGIMFIYIFANVGATYALYYFFRVVSDSEDCFPWVSADIFFSRRTKSRPSKAHLSYRLVSDQQLSNTTFII